MNDFIAALWPAFEAEVGEQLEQLEQMLARSGSGADIHFLFRQFHTLKGSSAMMEFHGMEALAHAAEDLLDLVRRGERPLEDADVDVLLQAVDVLRRQMADALRDRQSPAGDPALVARLRVRVSGAGEASPAAVAPVPAVRPTEDPTATATTPAADTEADAAVQQAVDNFLASARQTLPGLVEALALDLPLPEDIAELAAQAETAGLLVVTRLLHKLQPLSAQDGQRRRDLLEELLQRLRHIETLSGQDAGCATAFAFLRTALGNSFHDSAAAAVKAGATPLATAADADRSLQVMLPLRHGCRLLGLAASTRLLDLVMQVLRDVARGALSADLHLGEQLALAFGIVADLPPELAEDVTYAAMAEQLLDNIQQAIVAIGERGSAAAPAAVSAADLSVGAAMAALLTPALRAQVAEHLAAGHVLAEIDADLEAMPDGGAGFMSWLSRHGTPLANHTVFVGAGSDESTQLRFLAAFDAPLEAVAAGLAELDPAGLLLQLRPLAPGGAVAGSAPAAALLPPPAPVAMTPADSAGPAAADRAAAGPVKSASTVRIDSAALDRFVNRVGELVMLRNMMAHSINDDRLQDGLRRLRQCVLGETAPTAAEREQLAGLVDAMSAHRDHLLEADARLQDALAQLQDDVLALRVVPVSTVFNRMTRVVWGVAQAEGKVVEIDIRGEDTRIDKGMVDLLAEPLSHMVRNAVGHGIETPEERTRAGKPAQAVLTLAASQQGNALILTVADDGRGLDLPRILAKARQLGLAEPQRDYRDSEITDFIFMPGFSTAGQVTAISGRGVGMDVVKTRIAQLGGQVEVVSQPGKGTSFTLRLPLSVAIQNVVLVVAAERLLALPERQVNEVLRLPATALQTVQGQAACLLRGVVLPLYGLDRLLGAATTAALPDELEIVVFSDGRHRIGLIVDRVVGRQEVFVRDLHPDILRLPGVGGAAILGDGRVVVIADGDNLLELAKRCAHSLAELLRT